jgi:hypothetical protein
MIILICFKANELNQNELPPPPWGQWSNGINEPSINRGITPHRGGNDPMELMRILNQSWNYIPQMGTV